ncbi:MAG: GNAT family N-acetyltransferase [Saprospiraceae bacterium]
MIMDLTNYYNGIETERFVLRKLTYDDVESWKAFYINNPNLKYLGIDLNRTISRMAKAWIDAQVERYQQNAFGHLGIISKENGELVGTMGFKYGEHCSEGEIEKMTAIKPVFWRKGIATEVSIGIINAIFENQLARAIISVAHIDNDASLNNNVKLGFENVALIQGDERQIMKTQLKYDVWLKKHDFYHVR